MKKLVLFTLCLTATMTNAAPRNAKPSVNVGKPQVAQRHSIPSVISTSPSRQRPPKEQEPEPVVFNCTFNWDVMPASMQLIPQTLGEYYVLPTETETKKGHTFEGWVNLDDPFTEITATTKVELSQPHTLWATWLPARYTITLDAQRGTVDKNQLDVFYETPYDGFWGDVLPTPTRRGYTFKGWHTEAKDGIRVVGSDIMDKDFNHTLYAQWKLNIVSAFVPRTPQEFMLDQMKRHQQPKLNHLRKQKNDALWLLRLFMSKAKK